MSNTRHPTPRQSPQRSGSPSPRPRRRAAFVAAGVVIAGVAVLGLYSATGTPPGIARPGAAVTAPEPEPIEVSLLEADHLLHEFGDVPIGGGIVRASFVVTNPEPAPEDIVSVYTSCMCTTAELTFPDGSTEGPFGMPGHELPLTLDRALGSKEAVTVTVRFDPAAHGPAATGPVERKVALHTADGGTMILSLTANVVAE